MIDLITNKEIKDAKLDDNRTMDYNPVGLPLLQTTDSGMFGSTLTPVVNVLKQTIQTEDYRSLYYINHNMKNIYEVWGRYQAIDYDYIKNQKNQWRMIQDEGEANIMGQVGVRIYDMQLNTIVLYIIHEVSPAVWPKINIELYFLDFML